MCCCRKKKWLDEENGWDWFKQSKYVIEKMRLAQNKFDSEVDLKNIIMALRVSKFVAKMETNKRQRDSIAYFRRYTIDDKDVSQDRRRRTRETELLA